MAVRQTPLYQRCVAQRARMTEFAGWEMPVQFQGIRQEHEAVRTQAGLFDISHMGKFVLRGKGVVAALQRLVPSDLGRLSPGKAQYTVLLNPQGGIIDDLIFYLIRRDGEDEEVMAIVNAATTEKDKTWMVNQLANASVDLVDQSADYALLSVQGPKAVAYLQALTTIDLAGIPRFGHASADCFGQPAFLARTGYTGEDGFEIMVAPETAVQLWDALLEAGVTPCGLGARDTLRLEAAMALYGQDIDDSTTPLEAGLGWLVHLDKIETEIIGGDVLTQQQQAGVTRKLVGLTLGDRHIARHGYPVLHTGEVVGTVTSGTLSPTLGIPIALAYVPAALAKPGQALAVDIRGQHREATVVKRPFYRAG